MMNPNNNTELQDRLLKVMTEATGNSLDIYYVIYQEFLLPSERPSILLKTIFEYPDTIGKDDSPSEKVSPQVESETIRQYQEWLNNTVSLLIESNAPADVFYENLWNSVFCSPTAPKSVEQSAVILKILNEDVPTLPYYQAVNLIPMTNNEFAERLKKLNPRIREAVHMFNRHFAQRTEEVSQIYRLSQDLSPEDACVYWAIIINILQNGAFQAGLARQKSTPSAPDSSEESKPEQA